MKTEEDLIGCLDKLNKLCRVCLCESNVKSEPFNPYWESLFKKVMSCMQIDFLMKDMLPSEICDLCCKELAVADKLRIKCENSNAVLKRIYQQYLVKDEQRQSNQMDALEDELEIYDSDDEPLINNQNNCWDVPLEDDKDQVKDVILKVNLQGRVVNEDKPKKVSKKKSNLKSNKKESVDVFVEEITIKTEKDEDNGNIINDEVELSKPIKKPLYSCDICNKQLRDRRSIIAHITKQHGADKNKDLDLFRVTGYGSERLFHCTECPYVSKRKTDMKIHTRVHTGHRPHVCDICSRSFTQHASLAGHRLTHFDTKHFTCQECGKQFKHQKALKSHQGVHDTELRFVCKLCNKGLKSEKTLSNHMKRHSQIKNHSCELCGATFVARTELINHKHWHTNIKRFFCTQCEYSCHWRKSLELHIRRHLKDKTEQCDECEYACYTKVELKLHKRKHTKEQTYSCPICDEKFKQSNSINRHVRRKHGQKFTWAKVADRRFIK